jgi:hypothetical protein
LIEVRGHVVNTLEIGSGRTRVRLTWRRWGNDLHVHVGGGAYHIGAVALAGRQPNGETCESVFCVPPHKEGPLALNAAKVLHAAADATVCVTAGVHVDGITRAEIATVLRNVEEGVERLARRLGSSGARPSDAASVTETDTP